MKSFCFSAILAASFLGAMGTSKAELPPQVYAEQQRKAGEVLKIRSDEVVSKAKGFFDRSSYTETVTATVLEVSRSQSKVKKGDVITIRYERLVPKAGWVGPSPAPKLEKGGQYTAYLGKGEDGTFSLSAQGMSFAKIGD